MRIGINAFYLCFPEQGFGRYTQGIVEGLASVDKDNDYFLFVPFKPDLGFPLPENFSIVELGLSYFEKGGRIEWEKKFTSLGEYAQSKIDVLFIPYHSVPDRIETKLVLTLHDAIPLLMLNLKRVFKLPQVLEFVSLRESMEFKKFLKRAVEVADVFVVISEHSKKDLVSLGKVPSEKCVVVNPPVPFKNLTRPPDEKIAEVKNRLNLPERYILYVGGIRKRKNVEFLFKVVKRSEKFLRGEKNIKLVLVGYKKPVKKHERIVRGLGISDLVVFHRHIDERDLSAVYAGAEVFVFPSLYEGYGLPPVESLAVGTPVVASSFSSIPEAVNGAGILVDPKDVNKWSDALRKVLFDSDLRRSLMMSSEKVIEKVRPDVVGGKIKKVLEEVLGI